MVKKKEVEMPHPKMHKQMMGSAEISEETPVEVPETEEVESVEEPSVYYVRDSADRDFRGNGFDVELTANVKKEVSKEVAETLKEKFPYLEIVTE